MSIPNRILYSVAKRKKVNSMDETRTHSSPFHLAGVHRSATALSPSPISCLAQSERSGRVKSHDSLSPLTPSNLHPGSGPVPRLRTKQTPSALLALSLDKAPSFLRFTPSSGASGTGYDDQPNLTIQYYVRFPFCSFNRYFVLKVAPGRSIVQVLLQPLSFQLVHSVTKKTIHALQYIL